MQSWFTDVATDVELFVSIIWISTFWPRKTTENDKKAGLCQRKDKIVFLNNLWTHESVQFLFMSCMIEYFLPSPDCALIWVNLVPSTSVQCHLCLVFLWLPLLFPWSFTLWHLLPFAKETLKHENCPLNNRITLSLIYFIVCCKCLQCYTLEDLWQTNNSFLPRKDVQNSTVLQRAQSFLCNFTWPELWPCLFWSHIAPWLIPLWWISSVLLFWKISKNLPE